MRMHTAAAMLALFTLFCGCKAPDGKYGNFAETEGVDLLQDALSAMESAYPPAKTRLALLQPVDDVFGYRLVESLRAGGYAVAEYAPPAKTKGFKKLPPADPADGAGFAYVVDRDGDRLRVTLCVGDGTLSRLYQVQDGDDGEFHAPMGAWVRKR